MGLGHPIYARIYDFYMLPQELWMRSRRRRVVSGAPGKVLELGVGTGLNLPFYRRAQIVVATEPDPIMLRRSRRRAGQACVPVRLVQARGEALPFPDESFDTVIATLVFATVADAPAAACELYRVLRREGTFRFFEHYRSENPRLANLQDTVAPVWRRVLGGCEPNRDILSIFVEAGFEILETAKLPGTFLLDGIARPAQRNPPDPPTGGKAPPGPVKALVTGATGFIGSHLVETLISRGNRVRCLVRDRQRLSWLKGRSDIDIEEGDMTDTGSLRRAVAGMDCVYHLGALTRAVSARDFVRVNAQGTRCLVEACLGVGSSAPRLIYLSSLAAVGPGTDASPLREETAPHPVSTYGWSKLRGEEEVMAARNKIHVTILRPPLVYGPRDRNFLQYARWIKTGLLPLPAGPSRSVSLLHVDDLVRILVAASQGERSSGEVYHVAHERSVTWEDIGRFIAEWIEVRPRPFRIPHSLLLFVGCALETWGWVTEQPAFFTRGKAREATGYWVSDSSKAKIELGFVARMAPEEGLALTMQWYRKKGWI